LAVVALTIGVAGTAAGPSSSDGSTPACFGAASHDSYRPCDNPDLRYDVIPSPAQARNGQNASCASIADEGPLRVCEFGAPGAEATGTIALLGDSHAAHWRAALEFAAEAQRWRGVSLTLSGCPYSTATRVLRNELRARCIRRNQAVPDWFERHPRIHTVFVSELSGARWRLPPSARSSVDAEANAYVGAWERLPRSVRQIVVIRDTPKAAPRTAGCVERAHAAGDDAGSACAVPRSVALDPDAAASAARRVGPPRLRIVDMTRFFCDEKACRPVIGGALVQKDLNHLSVVFVRTLGPYLLDAIRRLHPPVY
jgi:SGNH domain (fused to AT3 domains)